MATITNTTGTGSPEHTAETAVSRQACETSQADAHPSGLIGWEWLDRPALLFIVIGSLGLIYAYTGIAVHLSLIRFPRAWACGIILIGGIILLCISMIAQKNCLNRPIRGPKRKSWRSL